MLSFFQLELVGLPGGIGEEAGFLFQPFQRSLPPSVWQTIYLRQGAERWRQPFDLLERGIVTARDKGMEAA